MPKFQGWTRRNFQFARRDSLTSQSHVSHGTARNKDGRGSLGEGRLIRKPGTRRDSKSRVAAAARSGAWRRAAAAAAVAATATPAGVVGRIRESWNAWLKSSSPGSSSGKERRSVGGFPGCPARGARRGPESTRDLAGGRLVAFGAGTVADAWAGWFAGASALAATAPGLAASGRLQGPMPGAHGAGCALAGLLQSCVPRTRHPSVRAVSLPGFPNASLACSVRKEGLDRTPVPRLPDKRH